MAQNSNNRSKGFRIDFNLTDKQKNFFAVLFSLVTLIVIVSVFVLIFSDGPEQADDTPDQRTASEILTDFDQTLSSINPEDLFFEDVTFEDLNIYPSAWVERNFSRAEASNDLISGPGADPDGDRLSNKLEFIYGANPNNPDSLCDGDIDDEVCVGRNDRENVDAGISPLTGLPLDQENQVFTINFQDRAVIETLEESFDNAAREGLDFPTLYQLSRTVGHTEDVAAITVQTEEETRQNLIDYVEYRIELVDEIIGSNELQTLSQVYSLVDVAHLEDQLSVLEQKAEEVRTYTVPVTEADTHKLYVYIFDKLVELVEVRIDGLSNDTIDTQEYQDNAKSVSIDIVWAYRELNKDNIVTASE